MKIIARFKGKTNDLFTEGEDVVFDMQVKDAHERIELITLNYNSAIFTYSSLKLMLKTWEIR